jgi:hypothetical protein
MSFTASSGSDASYPIENLSNYFPDQIWKSANATNGQTLVIHATSLGLGVASKNYIIVAGGNTSAIIAVPGRIRIQHAADSGFSSPTTVFDSDATGDLPYVVEFTTTTHAYFRVLYDNCGALVPYIGLIFLGQSLPFDYPYDNPNKPANLGYETSMMKALDGRLRTSQAYKGRPRWEVNFKGEKGGISDNFMTSFRAFFKLVRGRLVPFYWLDYDGTLYLVHLDMDVDPTSIYRKNVNDLSLVLQSQMVS